MLTYQFVQSCHQLLLIILLDTLISLAAASLPQHLTCPTLRNLLGRLHMLDGLAAPRRAQ
jgi:hypothetical protein